MGTDGGRLSNSLRFSTSRKSGSSRELQDEGLIGLCFFLPGVFMTLLNMGPGPTIILGNDQPSLKGQKETPGRLNAAQKPCELSQALDVG